MSGNFFARNEHDVERVVRIGLGLALPSIAVVIAFLAGQPLAAQEPLPLDRVEGDIVIDGVVNEPAWERMVPFDITQKVPVAGAPPSQPTEIRIGYDEDYIYLSGRLYDSEPDRIVANTKKRDDFTENTEWVGLLIDTYDDRENALGFWVTPTGAKLDIAISNDAQGGGQGVNTDWNAYWDAAVTRNESGWFAEIKIPFSSLPFAAREGRVVMGITTFRYIARNDETAIYPPRGQSAGSSFRPSLTQRFVFDGVRPTRAVSITPYLLGGRTISRELSPSGDRFESITEHHREVGLDARLGIAGNVTVDVTLNTDFAQVEVDDPQVSLNRLNLFYPEKRLFFQERASLFDFNFGAADKLFHSRRIGIVDGELARIYGGVRAVGKFGPWEAGALSMQTRALGPTDSENFAVFRLKRRVLNENSTVGMIVTNRVDSQGSFNTVYGVDGTLRIFAENFLSLRWAQSFAEQSDIRLASLDPARFFIELADRSPMGFTYGLSYGRAGASYDPAVGFQSRTDFSQFDYSVAYNLFPSADSRFVQYGPYATGGFSWGNAAGELESRNLKFGVRTFTKSGWVSDLHVRSDLEVLSVPLRLAGDLQVGAGRYPFTSMGGSVTSPSSRGVAGTVLFSTGAFFGGRKSTVVVSPTLTVTPDFILSGTHQSNWLTGVGTETSVATVRLTTVRFEYFLSTRLSASALVQHNSDASVYFGSMRIRYNPKEGNDLYIVFNGDVNQHRRSFEPMLPKSNRHTLQVKYSYALRP